MRALLLPASLGASGFLAGLAEGWSRALGGIDALTMAGLGGLLGMGLALLVALVGLALRIGGRSDPAGRAARLGVTAASVAAFVWFCHGFATLLAGRFREPRLMALVLGVLGMACALALVLAGVPLARVLRARFGGRAPPERPLRRGLEALAITGLAAQLGAGVVALRHIADPRVAGRLSRATLAGLALRAGRALTDFDADGSGLLVTPRDCAPFDAAVHPGARDRPGNGVDEDCSGADGSRAPRPGRRPRAGKR